MLLQTICLGEKERGKSNLRRLTILRTVYQLEMLFHALILHGPHSPQHFLYKSLRFMITSRLSNRLRPPPIHHFLLLPSP